MVTMQSQLLLKKGDFVYLDSPYIPDDKTQCTINYNKGTGWSYDDFMRYFDDP